MTGIIELIGASLVFLTSVIGVIQIRYGRREVRDVHVLVNSQLTAVLDRVKLLEQKLNDHGIALPEED